MKRIIAIYTVLLLGLTSAMATPNTMYFMEYLPYQSTMNPALQPRCTTYVEIPAISTVSLYANTGGLSLNDFVYVKDDKLVTFLHPEFGNKEAVYSKLMKSPGVDMEFDMSLFGFGFRVKEKGYVNINASVHVDATVGIPSDIITLGMYGTPDTLNVNSFGVDTPLALNAYLDLNGGYSEQINDEWIVGGRVHLLYGLANVRLNSDDLSLNLSQQEWNISGGVNGKMSCGLFKFATNENGEITGVITPESPMDYLKSLGYSFGAAVDLGAVYKPVPEVKISLSVKDLGFIVWNANSVELNGIIDYTYQGEKLPYEEGEEREYPNAKLYSTPSTYTTMTNGKIYAGVEYSFLENMMSVGVVSKTSYNYNHWDEEITVGYNLRPCSWFGLSASYSLISGKSSTIGLGVNLRIPPLSFYAVSDYTPVHYSAEGIPYKTSAVNVQAGLALTFGCKKKKAKSVEEEVPIIAQDVLPEPTQTEEKLQTVEPTQVEQPISE
jgi:hypothetical protein